MLRTQAVFLLAATMFGGVAQAAPGDSVPNFNVKAARPGIPWRRMLARRGPSSGSQCGPGAGFNEAVGGYQTNTTGSGRDA